MKKYVGSRVKDFNIRGDNPKVHFLLYKAENVPRLAQRPMRLFSAEGKYEYGELKELRYYCYGKGTKNLFPICLQPWFANALEGRRSQNRFAISVDCDYIRPIQFHAGDISSARTRRNWRRDSGW
jgi:hypothetical protein